MLKRGLKIAFFCMLWNYLLSTQKYVTKMTFVLAILFTIILLFIWRERYVSKKLGYYETLVNEIPFDSVLTDSQWRIQVISNNAVKNAERRRWMIGKTEMDYWVQKRNDPEQGKKRMELFLRALENKCLESVEETIKDRNGQERIYLRMAKPVFCKNGKHTSTVGFAYDLTAIKQKEQELAALNLELKRSNEDLDNFAHVASHDLRTPLRSITSFAQLFERKNRTCFDQTDLEYIRFISNSARQMDGLINSLLSYSSIDRQKEGPKNLEMDRILSIVKLNLSSLMNEKKAELYIAPLPRIVAHDFLMIQLFQNLIGNGFKYNKSDTPSVKVFCFEKDNQYTYAVQDNGIGIPPQYNETVFKIFHRLHGVEQFEGSGIGLAACKRIVEFYGGSIWFDSGESGTVFYISLPKCTVVEKPKVSQSLVAEMVI
jgi:signal transduction histidine kinase